MNKQEFLQRLRSGLTGLPQEDIEDRVSFYDELIDDKMEEGVSEEEAVRQIGPVDDVISQIISDTPLTKLVREKVKPKRSLQAWEIVLLILGAPIGDNLAVDGNGGAGGIGGDVYSRNRGDRGERQRHDCDNGAGNRYAVRGSGDIHVLRQSCGDKGRHLADQEICFMDKEPVCRQGGST